MITVVTLARNERYLAPFFLRHYERIADRIVVYDNQSDDGTPEFLAKHRKVEIRKYDTGGVLRDDVHAQIKSTAYRKLPGDWFIIVDFDELIWHPELKSYLDQCAEVGDSVPLVNGYSMIGDAAPVDDGKLLLTDAIRKGLLDGHYSKRCIVHRDIEVKYGPGCHSTMIAMTEEQLKRRLDRSLNRVRPLSKLLHYNWLSLEYGLNKRRSTAQQLSQENIANGWGLQCRDLVGEQKFYEYARARAVEVI